MDTDLKTFLKTLSPAERESFASRCNTTLGQLRNISYGVNRCGESLAINIERESAGVIVCEQLRPDVDWAYLRGRTNDSGLLHDIGVEAT